MDASLRERRGILVGAAAGRKVLVVAGPTASGKSAAALAIAHERPATVINADALQVYRDLAILTARPSEAESGAAPHRLYGVLDGADPCSAGRWRDMALAEIAAAHDSGRLPVLVGGTGMYLKALIEGIAPTPEVPDAIRADVRARLARDGVAALHAELAALDPAMAARLGPADAQRVSRALEVRRATGRSLAAFQAQGTPPPGLAFMVLKLIPPAEIARPVIAARCAAMIEAGALGEVRALLARGLDPALPVMKAVGVPELAAHLRGECDRQGALARFVVATQRYAKRQRTFFRHQLPAARQWDAQYSERIAGEIGSFIRLTC
ncbi:MAG: tRNA (adenosine(37)-N6)-dimethylallyltransferase MiaA [Alphaproteobacteria bacterium]|nr:tRNA (adenosine(37)-N6)-dimethylallyltransferase MiaA [Alphaproteobacteria bacterium]